MLEGICQLRPARPHWEDPDDISHHYCEKCLGEGSLASLKSSVVALLCRLDLTVGTAVTELERLNAMGIMGFWGGSTKWQHSNRTGKGVWLLQRTSESKRQSG